MRIFARLVPTVAGLVLATAVFFLCSRVACGAWTCGPLRASELIGGAACLLVFVTAMAAAAWSLESDAHDE